MSDNPYVREIKLFDPSIDLAVDDENLRKLKKKRPPASPVEGLLDDMDSSEPSSAPEAPRTAPARGAAPAGRGAPAAQAGPPPATPPAPPAGGQVPAQPVMGEAPDMIEGDFPEPIDL